jgi:apolipoprotein N-acyltransferase
MKFSAARAKLPTLKNSLLALLSAVLLILAFPDFDLWFTAWFALVPLFYAIDREKESSIKSFVLGWIFGTSFFLGSCWWLTYAPVNYGGVPTVIAYFLLFGATSVVGLFPAIFSLLFSLALKRFGTLGILSAPFLWVAVEFLRFHVTGNNWNAIGYSHAFNNKVLQYASIGGVYLVGFGVVFGNSYLIWLQKLLKEKFGFGILTWIFPYLLLRKKELAWQTVTREQQKVFIALFFLPFLIGILTGFFVSKNDYPSQPFEPSAKNSFVIAIQPNVPMSGLKFDDKKKLRLRHVELAEDALQKINERRTPNADQRTIVIFPESPMNFEYDRDREFQQFLRDFTAKNNVSVLFNAAEPAVGSGLYNSAVLVDERGAKRAQYDKIHLVPFGEYAPVPRSLASFVPTMVGSFEFGKSYNLMPFGAAQAGIMICFESHFPTLAREFARQGADVLVELTNDGYLGNTPVLRQHLANAVFRAVETNRPVLRVTNVGITAYIDENGKIHEQTQPYAEETRIWSVKKSAAAQTFYVKYGDWFAWLCSIVSAGLLIFSFRKRRDEQPPKFTN